MVANAKQMKLPPLRKGVTFAFSDYDRDGKPQWLIHDAGRNKFFIIGWVEFELLERWYLGNADDLISATNSETTLHIDEQDIKNLINFLEHNYLIQQSGYAIYRKAIEQKIFKKDNIIHWLIHYYLFFKIPLLHPDKFLDKTKSVANVLFSRWLAVVMVVLAIIAIYQLNLQWDKFTHTFTTLLNWRGLVFYLIGFLFAKLCHEMGHAYMCRKYGVPVPTLGIAFLVFWPLLYTDTTLSWSLSSQKRMRIALAGMWVETYVTIIAALLWCNVNNLTLQTICYLIITVNWLASIFINISPFMRFDGYYVLADYLKIPNLQPRAFALTRWQIRRWLFHWPDPPPENFTPGMHRFLVVYSIITWIYRLIIYFGIAILVYHFFIKLIGILLFIVEILYFILLPIYNEIKIWIYHKEKFSFNKRTKITLFSSLLLIFLFFLPIKETVNLPGTLSYAHHFLIAPEEGVLVTPLPKLGTQVKSNQPIIKLESKTLDYNIGKVRLEYEKKLNEFRRASINQRYAGQKGVILSDLNRQKARYQKLLGLRDLFTLRVPFDGMVKDVPTNLKVGSYVMKDEWLGDVVQPNVIRGEAFIAQEDVNDVRIGLEGNFYPDDPSKPTVAMIVKSIEIVNASKLDCVFSGEVRQGKNENVIETPCYNASDLGGLIPTFYTNENEYVPVNSVFLVVLTAKNPMNLNHVERGVFILKTERKSLAYWFFYKLKKMWIEQSGF